MVTTFTDYDFYDYNKSAKNRSNIRLRVAFCLFYFVPQNFLLFEGKDK